MPLPSPAPRSTRTWWPREVRMRTPAGVIPTRYSRVLISLGTPIIMARLLRARVTRFTQCRKVLALISVYSLVRPLLFALDPGLAHALGMAALAPLEYFAPLRAAVRATLARPRPRLRTRAMGLLFPSPVGLAAGFDKDARRARALAALGFGHVELGTVTALAQEPNPPPNLFRLPKDRALVNRLGFPNEGAERVTRRLAEYGGARAVGIPVGISIGKSRAVAIDPLAPVVADYVTSFGAARRVADFVVVNVSSPNTKDLRALQDAGLARE